MPLSHLRVVEIGSAAASAYCARPFADFGAHVSKVGPARADPILSTTPTPGEPDKKRAAG